jgi:hypothetical protein
LGNYSNLISNLSIAGGNPVADSGSSVNHQPVVDDSGADAVHHWTEKTGTAAVNIEPIYWSLYGLPNLTLK